VLKKQGVQRWIFDELKTLRDTRFRFISKDSTVDYVILLSSQMRRDFPLELIISARSILREFNPDLIARHLNELRPDNFRLTIVAQNFPNGLKPTLKEKWFSVDYTLTSISEDLIKVKD
jgi:insulysin